MGFFINRKKAKVTTVFWALGSDDYNEESFIILFKEKYPEDWILINKKWKEEQTTPPGKRHPMKHPNIYMKEMYRNWKQYF